jgi:hypothetical protein
MQSRKFVDIPTVQLDECRWYHRTNLVSAEKIQKGGFRAPDDPEASFQYTKGIYFMNNQFNERAASYGKASVEACVIINSCRKVSRT